MKAKCTKTGPFHEVGGKRRGFHAVKGEKLDGDRAAIAVAQNRAQEIREKISPQKETE